MEANEFRQKHQSKIKTVEAAYKELWSAVENGEVDKKFFKLRSRFRNVIQISEEVENRG